MTICYDYKLINYLKILPIQNISSLLTWKTPSFPTEVLASPDHRHLKSSSPQVPVPDNNIKAGIFPGEVIIVENGK